MLSYYFNLASFSVSCCHSLWTLHPSLSCCHQCHRAVYSITLVVTCFKLFHFKRIISAHYLEAYKRTLSLDRVQSRSSLSNVRLDETKSRFGITLEGGTITPLFAGHVAFLNANVFDPLTSLEEHASLHRIHSKSIIFNFVYFPIEWSSVLYFHSSHRLILWFRWRVMTFFQQLLHTS